MKKEMTLKEHMEKARAAIDPVKKAAASKENGKLGGRPVNPNSKRQQKLKK